MTWFRTVRVKLNVEPLLIRMVTTMLPLLIKNPRPRRPERETGQFWSRAVRRRTSFQNLGCSGH
jgi:hypothetical protein